MSEKFDMNRTLGIYFLISLASGLSHAASPPFWCESKVGNTFYGGCDLYFNSRHDAANAMSEKYKPRTPYYFEYTEIPKVGDFSGQSDVGWHRSGRWLNEPYNVWVSEGSSGRVFPYCPPIQKGRRYNDINEESFFCGGSEIYIEGDSSTMALPIGPVIHQKIIVKTGNYPVADKNVQIWLEDDEGEVSYSVSRTNSKGEIDFSYIPPFFVAADVVLKATCSDCTNFLNKKIEVEGIASNEWGDEGPQMCRR